MKKKGVEDMHYCFDDVCVYISTIHKNSIEIRISTGTYTRTYSVWGSRNAGRRGMWRERWGCTLVFSVRKKRVSV